MNVLKELMNVKITATILWVATPADVVDLAIDFIVMAPPAKVSHIVKWSRIGRLDILQC